MDAVSLTTTQETQEAPPSPPARSAPDVDSRSTISNVLLAAAIDELDELVHTMHNMVGEREEPGDHEVIDQGSMQIRTYLDAVYLWESDEGVNLTVITVKSPDLKRVLKFAIPGGNDFQKRRIAAHIASELTHAGIAPVNEVIPMLETLNHAFPTVEIIVETCVPFIYSVE